ncbi:MAG: hypothetical protein M3Q70_00780 [bacterium]|nr:hypothetical protein [bacterium]
MSDTTPSESQNRAQNPSVEQTNIPLVGLGQDIDPSVPIEEPSPYTIDTVVVGGQTFLVARDTDGVVLARKARGEGPGGSGVFDEVMRRADRVLASRNSKDTAQPPEGQLFAPEEFPVTQTEADNSQSKQPAGPAAVALEKSVQLGFFEETEKPKDPKVRTKKVAFGGFVKPELYDVFGEHNFNLLTPAEKAWKADEALGKVLFEPPKPDPQDEEAQARFLTVDGYSFNAHEYRMLIRSPRALARKTVAHVLGDNDITDTKQEASQRGVGHVMNKLSEPMQEHVAKLREARTEVQELAREAKSPGFAHRSEEWMTGHLSTVWKEFQTMLDIMHVQKGWDDEKRQAASTALLHFLSSGPQRQRTGRWQTMISLADGYLGARITVFDNRIKQAADRIPTANDQK